MAISPRAPLLARVVLALQEPPWGLDVARPTWREKRGEKGISSISRCCLGIRSRVRWLGWEGGMEKGDKAASMSL